MQQNYYILYDHLGSSQAPKNSNLQVQAQAQAHPGRRPSCLMATEVETKKIWRTADCVCFDVDSTVCEEEGIDELAKFCGVGEKVSEWTKKAMGGNMGFREALKHRLNIISPSHDQLETFLRLYPSQLTSGIKELVHRLKARGTAVYLVSGGFRPIIEPVAKQLGIPVSNVYANRLTFFFNGEYAGFDETQMTSLSGGKGQVIEHLKKKYGYQKLVMVGDGATDLEASPPADAFIGFGGNAIRERVKQEAKWYAYSFQEMLSEL